MNIKAVDLFAGAGGFTEGAQRAGVDVIFAANHWPVSVDAHEANHPGVEHECQDLRQFDFESLPDFDMLLASPACQGHSTAGQGSDSARAAKKHEADRNTALAVIECADKKRPETILVENVPRFAKWELFDWWCDGLRVLGYHVTSTLVDAADLGVPQNRKRIVVAASLKAPVEFEAPKSERKPFSSVLLDIDEGWTSIKAKSANIRKRIDTGREKHGDRFLTQYVTKHPGRSLDRPIGTITTAPSHWHLVDGQQMRSITTAELLAAQDFRPDYIIPDNVALATRLIGNAIPPALAKWAIEQAA